MRVLRSGLLFPCLVSLFPGPAHRDPDPSMYLFLLLSPILTT